MLCPKCGGAGNIAKIDPIRWFTCWGCFGSGIVSNRLAPIEEMPRFIFVGTRFNQQIGAARVTHGATVFEKSRLEKTDNNFAHVVTHLGWFKSSSQARKAGWDAPIENGKHSVGKRVVEIVDNDDWGD